LLKESTGAVPRLAKKNQSTYLRSSWLKGISPNATNVKLLWRGLMAVFISPVGVRISFAISVGANGASVGIISVK